MSPITSIDTNPFSKNQNPIKKTLLTNILSSHRQMTLISIRSLIITRLYTKDDVAEAISPLFSYLVLANYCKICIFLNGNEQSVCIPGSYENR